MRVQSDPTGRSVDPEDGDDAAAFNAPVHYVSGGRSQRVIQVGDARTIIVRPRIPGWYKTLLGVSLAMNLLILLLLLIFGVQAYRLQQLYRAFAGEISTLAAGNPAASSLAELDGNPSQVAAYTLETTRNSVDQALAAVQELEGATIRGEIPINHQLPLQLQMPIQQDTTVTTNAPVPVEVPALISLPGNGGYLNTVVSFELPAGMALPVRLGLTVPLSATVPLDFQAPVNIPVRDTELDGPFARLRRLLEPAAAILNGGQR